VKRSRLIAFALAFFPRGFREEFGEQIQVDAAERRDVASTGFELMVRGLGLHIEALWRDARFSARTLLKSPLFTIAAVATLAVAISVNTAVFGAVVGDRRARHRAGRRCRAAEHGARSAGRPRLAAGPSAGQAGEGRRRCGGTRRLGGCGSRRRVRHRRNACQALTAGAQACAIMGPA